MPTIDMDALEFEHPFGTRLVTGELTMLVRSNDFDIAGRRLLVLEGTRAVGEVTLRKPFSFGADRFLEFQPEHGLHEEALVAPGLKGLSTLWAFRVEEAEAYAIPKTVSAAVTEPRVIVYGPFEIREAEAASAEPVLRLGEAMRFPVAEQLAEDTQSASAQLHKRGDEVWVFGPDGDDVTEGLPDIVASARALPARELVLVGDMVFPTEDDAILEAGKPWPMGAGLMGVWANLLPLIPEHRTYVEAFCGSGELLWRKDPSVREVLSDIDDTVVFALRHLKECSEQAIDRLRNRRWSFDQSYIREMREKLKSGKLKGEDRFFAWILNRKATFSESGIRHQQTPSVETTLKRLKECRERLQSVDIEQGDFREAIKRHDSESTFFLLDPPYDKRQLRTWQSGITPEDLIEGLGLIKKGKFLLLNQFTDATEASKIPAKHTTVLMRRGTNQIGTEGPQPLRPLYLYANYSLPDSQRLAASVTNGTFLAESVLWYAE